MVFSHYSGFYSGQRNHDSPLLQAGERVAPPPVVDVVDKWVDLQYPGIAALQRTYGYDPGTFGWAHDSRVQ